MRFKDKDGNILVDIRIVRCMYCEEKDCSECPLHNRGGCVEWAVANPVEAAKLMGWEIVEEGGVCKEMAKPTRESILEAARKCVCGDREQDYGSPENNFRTIANLWIDYLSAKSDPLSIEPEDAAAMLGLLKIARIATGHAKEDNWIDLAGYAACGGEIQGGRSE